MKTDSDNIRVGNNEAPVRMLMIELFKLAEKSQYKAVEISNIDLPPV